MAFPSDRDETDKSQRLSWPPPWSIVTLKRAFVEYRKGCRWAIGTFCSTGKNLFSKLTTAIDAGLLADYFFPLKLPNPSLKSHIVLPFLCNAIWLQVYCLKLITNLLTGSSPLALAKSLYYLFNGLPIGGPYLTIF